MYKNEIVDGNLKLIMEYTDSVSPDLKNKNDWISFKFVDVSNKKCEKNIFEFNWNIIDKIEAYFVITLLENWPIKMQERIRNIFNDKKRSLCIPHIYFMKKDDDHNKRIFTVQFFSKSGFIDSFKVDDVIINANKYDEFNKFISNFIKYALKIDTTDILYLL